MACSALSAIASESSASLMTSSMGTSGAQGGRGLEQQAGGIFSASDEGRGEATGGGIGIGSGVEGAEETVPREWTSILGVWNSGEYSGEAGTHWGQGVIYPVGTW